MKQIPGRLVLTWDRIRVGSEEAPIAITLELSLAGDELLAEMCLTNDSRYTVKHAWFPVIGGTAALASDSSDRLLVADSRGGRNRIENLYHREWSALD